MQQYLDIKSQDILTAQNILKRYINTTPLERNSWLSERFQCDIFLKLENMQPIGAFKIRGATYKLIQLTEEQKSKGVIAASAGNHAQGVAWGARKLGIKALIVMPIGATLMKVENTKKLGAEVILHGVNYDEAYQYAQKISKETGRTFVHAYEDPSIIAGQGCVGLEILEQLPGVDYVIGSIGGGGLMSGVGLAIKSLKPEVKVVGCQASGASSMIDSIKQGKAVLKADSKTFADGIHVSQASEAMRKILSECLDDVLHADDELIAAAILTYLEKAKLIVEGAAAVPLAVLNQIQDQIKGKKVVLIVSGGNIDVNFLGKIIERGLSRAGRRLRLNVIISDQPGSLSKLTDLIAAQGANIIQTIHDRNETLAQIDQTDVALTLETKGKDHSDQLIAALKENVVHLERV